MVTQSTGLSEWAAKYGKVTAYTSAVILVTAWFIRLDANFSAVQEKLTTLQGQMSTVQSVIQDRDKYERWRRGFNSRLKRLYNARGWEYEEVE